MKISEIRDWATETFGAHSHKESQVHAALQPLEEWLGHLARQGVMLELLPQGLPEVPKATEPEAAEIAPPVPLAPPEKEKKNTQGVSKSPPLDPSTFVKV